MVLLESDFSHGAHENRRMLPNEQYYTLRRTLAGGSSMPHSSLLWQMDVSASKNAEKEIRTLWSLLFDDIGGKF
jgi:hypothetical protein